MSSIFFNKVHAENVLQQLWQDCEIEELCDVVLIAGNDGIRVPAHRNILSATSSYYRGMFKSSMRESTTKEIIMVDVNGAILRSLVEYCYTGRVAITEDIAVELLKFADFLNLSDVVAACGKFLSEQLHPSNCLGLTLFAEQYRCEILLKKAKEYSLKHFLDVCKMPEFLSLNSEQLSDFLASDSLGVPAEENVFDILMTWIQHEQIEREQHKDQLLKLVRLPLLERSFLIEKVKPICTSMESFQLYVDALECQLLPDHKIFNARKSINSDQFLMCLTHNSDNSGMKINFYCPQRLKWMRCLKNLKSRNECSVAVMHDNLYVVGGSDEERLPLNTVICINLKTMTVGQINPMAQHRSGCGAAVLNGYLYAVGGYNGDIWIRSVEKWDPKTNTWSKVASMLRSRNNFSIAQLDEKLFAVGSSNISAEYYDVHQNVWKSIAPMKGCSNSPTITVANDLLYIADCWGKVECYDPQSDKWTILCSLPMSNYCTKFCTTLCNKVIVCCEDQFYEYSDKTNEWETKEIFNGIENIAHLIAYSGKLPISEFT